MPTTLDPKSADDESRVINTQWIGSRIVYLGIGLFGIDSWK